MSRAPRKAKKPVASVIAVTKTLEATAGSTSKRSSTSGTTMPTSAATRLVGEHAAGDDEAEFRAAEKIRPTSTPVMQPSTTPLQMPTSASRPISRQVLPAIELLGGEGAHRDGQRLRAGVAAEPGDDREQHGEDGDPLDRRLETG